MLDGLRLGALDVGRDEEEGCVHDCCPGEHGGEEDLVAWTVAEGDMSLQDQGGLAALVIALGVVLLVTGVGLEAIRCGTGGALEDLGVGVAESDGDVTDSLLPESYGGDSGDGPDDGGLAMGHVAYCAYVERGLPAHDLRGVGGEGGHVFVVLGSEFLELGVELVNLLLGHSRDRIHLLL